MKMITGALLILASEQAFSHAHLITFPHTAVAREVLMPGSIVLMVLGVGLLVWGLLDERGASASPRRESSEG